MVSMMQDVVERGTATSVRAWGVRFPVGAKTGTTNDFKDAWFCGYTPQLEATVWVGYSRAEIPMESVHGIAVAGPAAQAV